MTKKPVKKLFGGAVQAAVDAAASGGGQTISVADAGSSIAFLDSWVRILGAYARRLREANQSLSAPVMLAHVDDSGKFALETSWAVNPLLGMSVADDLAGILAVGTAEFGACLNPVRLHQTSEFYAAIKGAGIGTAMTLALMDVNTLYIWPEGVDGDARPQKHLLGGGAAAVDATAIEKGLDFFYAEEARDRAAWWRDTKSRITVDGPERAVQEVLRVFLMGRFAERAKVREEIVSGNGRMDITVQAVNGGNFAAVLELKTSRDVRTPKRAGNKPIRIPPKTNIRWAKSGVQQAAAYRDREHFQDAFMCLYDFSKSQGSDIVAAIALPAALYKVRVKHYLIYASHEELRDTLYPVK